MVSKITYFIIFGLIIFTKANHTKCELCETFDVNSNSSFLLILENVLKKFVELGSLLKSHRDHLKKLKLEMEAKDDLKKKSYRSSYGEYRDEYNSNSGREHSRNRDYNSNSGREHSRNRDYNYNIINEKYDRHMLCNGKSCSIDRDDDRSYRNSPRCYGNKCSRQPYENDYSDDRYDENGFYKDFTRNRLSSNDDDRDAIDAFRCIGDKCYRNINVNNARDNLRCIGEECSRYSANDRDRDRIENDRYAIRNGRYDRKNDISNDRDGLRCDGYRCDNRKGNGEKDTNDQDQDAFRTRTRSHKSKPSNKHKPFILDMVVRKDIKNILGKLEKKKMQIDEDNAEKRNGLFKTYLYDMRDQMLDLLDFHYGHGDKEVARKWLNFWL